MQMAANLNRRLVFRRTKFTPPRKSPQFAAAHLQCSVVNSTWTVGLQGGHGGQSHSVQCMLQLWPNQTLYFHAGRKDASAFLRAVAYCYAKSREMDDADDSTAGIVAGGSDKDDDARTEYNRGERRRIWANSGVNNRNTSPSS